MKRSLHVRAIPTLILITIGLTGCRWFDPPILPGDGDDNDHKKVAALSFDGTNDYVLVPNARNLQVHAQGSFTIDAWFKADSWDRWNWIAAHGLSNANNDVLFGFDRGRPRFITQDLSNDLMDDERLETGKWYHLAGVQDAENGVMWLYVNGEPVTRLALSGQYEVTRGDLFIGARESYGTGRAVENFDGIIHELRIWKTAMNHRQIRQIMHERVHYSDDDLVAAGEFGPDLIAHWPLSEGTGTTAYDNSGHEHHGEIMGDATWMRVIDPIH